MEVLEYDDIPGEGEHIPVKIKRLLYNQFTGLYELEKERKLKKRGVGRVKNFDEVPGTRKKITDDPDEIVKKLFGERFTADELITVRDVWEAFKKTKMWKNKTIRDEIRKDFEEKMSNGAKGVSIPEYMNFNESLNEAEEEQDSKSRVAVIITDGKLVMTGQSPQSEKINGKFDLFKGHAKVGEDLKEAACREVMEECGLRLDASTLEQVSGPIKYLSGTTITFFVAHLEKLPSIKMLKCNSFYEYQGRQYPEIAAFHYVPIENLVSNLYKSLVDAMTRGEVFEKLENLNESKELSIDKLSDLIVESIVSHKYNKKKIVKVDESNTSRFKYLKKFEGTKIDDLPWTKVKIHSYYNNNMYADPFGNYFMYEFDEFSESGNIYILPENYDINTNPDNCRSEWVCCGHCNWDEKFIFEPDNHEWT